MIPGNEYTEVKEVELITYLSKTDEGEFAEPFDGVSAVEEPLTKRDFDNDARLVVDDKALLLWGDTLGGHKPKPGDKLIQVIETEEEITWIIRSVTNLPHIRMFRCVCMRER